MFPQYSSRNDVKILEMSQLRSLVPSAFVDHAHIGMSNHYRQFRTDEVIYSLGVNGWSPISAKEEKVRTADRQNFQKHLLRFQRTKDIEQGTKDQSLGDSRLELLLTNSHDGKCSYQIRTGVYRLVCLNGLVRYDDQGTDIRLRHNQGNLERVVEASCVVADQASEVNAHLNALRSHKLANSQKVLFAKKALALRYGSEEEAPVYPVTILEPKRAADRSDDLWTVLNIVQENMMRGSRMDWRTYKEPKENKARRRSSVRALTGINSQLSLNEGLWQLASEFLALSA